MTADELVTAGRFAELWHGEFDRVALSCGFMPPSNLRGRWDDLPQPARSAITVAFVRLLQAGVIRDGQGP